MKAILVPVEHHAAAEFPLRLAAKVAGLFGSVIETFALQRPPLGVASWDPASVAIMNEIEWDHGKVSIEARHLVERVMEECGIPESTTLVAAEEKVGAHASGASWRWNEEPMASDSFLGSFARAFDLTVVSQPGSRGASIATLEAALFDSGGPILIAPPRDVSQFGETIVIAWNGSSETARTIGLAMPLLLNANSVVVLLDDGSLGHRPSGKLVCERLERNGISAQLKQLPAGTIRSGEEILKEANAFGCDLLVKGAYTQSRLRQMIFGGTTQHILAKATVPVFMAH